jgi:HEAT repeat protein
VGLGCALFLSLTGPRLAGAEDTTEPGAGRAALPATGRPAEAKLKGPANKGDKAKLVPEAAPAPLPGAELGLTSELRDIDEAVAAAAARKLVALQTPAATDALLDALTLGVTPKVAGAVLDALAAYKVPADSASARTAETLQILALYAHHRSAELRKRAVQALAALIAPPAAPAAPAAGKPPLKNAKVNVKVTAAPTESAAAPVAPQVVPLLIAALSDSSSEVRAVAAEALGERRERSAEPALIKLLLRKDSAAPAALGKIGGADTARALSEMIGNVPDSFITETLGLLLLRSDFGPDPLRLEVVKTLGKLPGGQPIDILSDYLKETGKDKADKARLSRIEASKIIEQRTAK